MSTNRTVHVIPETEQIAFAISLAARLWPEFAAHPEILLGKILDAGLQELNKQSRSLSNNRTEVTAEIGGTENGIWPANWRDELMEDWPD
jgi:hypothetical protein